MAESFRSGISSSHVISFSIRALNREFADGKNRICWQKNNILFIAINNLRWKRIRVGFKQKTVIGKSLFLRSLEIPNIYLFICQMKLVFSLVGSVPWPDLNVIGRVVRVVISDI